MMDPKPDQIFRFLEEHESDNEEVTTIAEFYLDKYTRFAFVYFNTGIFQCRLEICNMLNAKGEPVFRMRDNTFFNFGETPCADLGEVSQGLGNNIVPRYSLLEDKENLIIYERQMTGITNVFSICNKLEYSLMKAKINSLQRKGKK